ncbi:MAG: hypothetical protein K6E74_04505 [Bacilli bacterium]|nr:hypothetical protein [Bacilli bacterium]
MLKEFWKKIFTNGVFNTMIDERINIKIRRAAWFIVSLLYILGISAIALMIPLYNLPVWKGIMIAFLVFAIIGFISLYIRLWHHLRVTKKKNKRSAIEKELRMKAQLKASDEASETKVYKTEKPE